MVVANASPTLQALLIEKEVLIHAPIDLAFEAVLEEMGPAGEIPGGKPLPRVLEAWPGGRWFRDTGHNTGHLWGHVQVIKPPTLLEITGPLFMSFPALNHVQYRLTAEGTATRLKLTHRALGEIPAEHREGVGQGWGYALEHIAKIAHARTKK